MLKSLAHFQTLPLKDATRQLHHAFKEIENKPFIIPPSSFILFTMLGSTLSHDPLADKRFDFPFVNPPYGDEWSKDYDLRWQPSGARQIAKGNPQRKRGGVHQFGVPPKGNANFASVQHFIYHIALLRI